MNKALVIGAVAAVVVGAIGYGAMSQATNSAPTGPRQSTSERADDPGDVPALKPFIGTVTESGGFTGDVAEGGIDAKVTIIEYTSFTCPHCKTFHEDIYTPFKADYIDTGKVKFIYRDFPLDNYSLAASIVSRCGGEAKYLGFVDLFMTQQERWITADNVVDELKTMAKLGGLGSERLDACLGDSALGQSILDRAKLGEVEFGVNATPTVLLNGKRYTGPLTLEAFTAQLNAMLDE